MVRITKFFTYSLFFILVLMYFMPKVNTYYLLEQELKKYDVVVNSEQAKDTGFALNIKDSSIFVKSTQSANVEDIKIRVFVLYNKIKIKNIKFSKTMKSFIPLHVDRISIKHSILNPLIVNIDGVGKLGEFEGKFHLLDRNLYISLKPSKIMLQKYKSTLKKFKKSENGSYIYEKNI